MNYNERVDLTRAERIERERAIADSNRKKKIAKIGIAGAISAVLLLGTAGCTRIETGEVGIRVGFDKQIATTELQPGSFNQVLIGEVLTFPVKDVVTDVTNLTPLAKDNSTMKDFDVQVIYSVNPSSVAELYTKKSRGFHALTEDGDTLLMYKYIYGATRNAAYKAARNYEALIMSDNRAAIEQDIRETLTATLASEQLDTSISITQVLVRQITPADSVVASANALVRAKNELLQKEVEVKTAEAEARRIAALNANKGAVEYMEAMALMNISEGIKSGKVNTIVVPVDFKGMVNVTGR